MFLLFYCVKNYREIKEKNLIQSLALYIQLHYLHQVYTTIPQMPLPNKYTSNLAKENIEQPTIKL